MKKQVLYLLFITLPLFCFSQIQEEKTIIEKSKNGTIQSVEFSENDKSYTIPANSAAFFKDWLKTYPKDQFIKVPHFSKIKEFVHEHFDQYYNGVKVVGGGYNFHYKNGKMLYAHGNYININEINTSPSISAEKAKELFAKYQNIPLTKVTDFISELLIKEIGNDSETLPKLVFKIYLYADDENNNEIGFVDAQTGTILKTEPSLINYSATGTFTTRYNGSRQGITQNYGGAFHLADSTRAAIIHTWNLNGSTNTTSRIELSDDNNNWTSAEHSASENDMGLDVHWALQQIHDYLNTHHQLNSFNDDGFPINAYIHFGTSNDDKDNAGWSPTLDLLVFGDGAVKYRPISSLDAVAHEFGHGITDFQIGWDYFSGDGGAFHEGLSDIWAAILENRINPNSIWQIGEQIDLGFGCLRNIQNTNDQNARYKISDTYQSSQYNYGDLYVKGGVFSHWFYLLVNGGTGINGIGNNYTVYGVGMDMVENLIVEAVTNNYLDNTTTYPGIRTAMVNAANILYGTNSFQSLQVANAWYAVGVGTNPGQPTISGPQTVCYSSASTFTANNPPTGSAISWSVAPTLTIVSGGNTTTPSIRAASSSSRDAGWIQAKFTSSIPPTITSDGPKVNVSVNGPYYNDISFDVYKSDGTHVTNTYGLCPNTTYHIYVMNSGSCSTSNYSWTIPSGWTNFYTWSNMISINTNSASGGNIVVSANTACNNNIVIISGYMSSGSCGGYYLAISPNPTVSETTIELMPEGEKTIDENIQWELDVYDQMQGIKAKYPQIKGKQTKINASNWKDGVYIVRAKIGDKIITEKLLVKH